MVSPVDNGHPIADASKRMAQQTLVVLENRFELLLLEIHEERDRIFRAFCLSVGVSVFGLLGGVALTALVTVASWNWSPVAALGILTLLYVGMAAFLYARVTRLRRDWDSFSATFNELRKDRECLKRHLN